MINKRKYYLDFLKVIGLFGIIFSHVEPPGIIMMARSFDVPLMVLISAILAKQSFEKNNRNAISYIIGRVKRLVIPTWSFLIFYFLIQALFGNVNTVSYYISSFLLTRYGVGYVWIVLIYLYCAISVPFLYKAKNKKRLFVACAIIYIIYEIAHFYSIGTENKFIMSTVYYIIPYAILTAIGLNFESLKKRTKIIICVLSFVGFLTLAIYFFIKTGDLVSVSHYKYPPVFYYLTYAICCSTFLFLLFENKEFKFLKNKFVLFISRHSFWIYLWHVFYLTMYKYFCENVYDFNSWIFKFIIILTLSSLTVWLQNKTIDLCERKTKRTMLKYFRG